MTQEQKAKKVERAEKVLTATRAKAAALAERSKAAQAAVLSAERDLEWVKSAPAEGEQSAVRDLTAELDASSAWLDNDMPSDAQLAESSIPSGS